MYFGYGFNDNAEFLLIFEQSHLCVQTFFHSVAKNMAKRNGYEKKIT